MSRFAIGKPNTNCVWIRIDKDWTYRKLAPLIGEHQYAAHGGLSLYMVTERNYLSTLTPTEGEICARGRPKP